MHKAARALDLAAAESITDGLFSEEALRNAEADGINLFARVETSGTEQRSAKGVSGAGAEQNRIDGSLTADYFTRTQWNHSTCPKAKAKSGSHSHSPSKLSSSKGTFASTQGSSKSSGFKSCSAASAKGEGRSEKEILKAKFQALDKNGDGSLEYAEAKGLLRRCCPTLTEQELEVIFKAVDSNGNGRLEFGEFIDFIFAGDTASSSHSSSETMRPSSSMKPACSPGVASASAPLDRTASPLHRRAPNEDEQLRQWKADVLEAHNKFRALHGAPTMEWSDDCYEQAQRCCSQSMLQGKLSRMFEAAASSEQGQNCYQRSAKSGDGNVSAEGAVSAWYAELQDPGYDFMTNCGNHGTESFTQLVWMSSKRVGMAKSEDGNFVIAHYFPKGNVPGEFETNVRQNSAAAFAEKSAFRRSLTGEEFGLTPKAVGSRSLARPQSARPQQATSATVQRPKSAMQATRVRTVESDVKGSQKPHASNHMSGSARLAQKSGNTSRQVSASPCTSPAATPRGRRR